MHSLKTDYMVALKKQLKFELNDKLDKQNKKIETIFIGGGTPSCIDAIEYKSILDIVQPFMLNNIEITIEANPNSATYNWQKEIYDIGINRISFGVQSFNDNKLDFLGRNHTSNMAISAIQNAKKVGFRHINCDIIYDTKLDTKELLNNDLRIIKTLPVDHISAYSLTLEEGTKFFNKSNVKVENIDMANYLFDELKKLGFNQYEISNFAQNDEAKSKHNLGYWRYTEYLGIGAGAVGCKEGKRLYTFKDLDLYIKNPTIYDYTENLTTEDIKVEKVLLGLRCEVGIDKNLLTNKELIQVNNLEELGKIISKKNNHIYSTDFMLADELALYILE